MVLPLAGLIFLMGAWTLSATNPNQDTGADPSAPDRTEHAQEEHTPLQLSMKSMSRNMKAMRPLLSDLAANQAAIIKAIDAVEVAMIQGLSLVPPRPEKEMTDLEWAQYETSFHQGIHASLGLVLKMKMAALADDADTVIENYKNLRRGKKDGHGTYKMD
ncbi:MAG: hypothetical protein GY930_17010 [bacterium]|nr:hypothetical protein [bacterium]